MRRLAFFLAVNAIVSVVVTLSVLWIWDLTHADPAAVPPPTAGVEATAPPGEEAQSDATLPAAADGTPQLPGAEAATDDPGAPPGLATITPTVYTVQSGDTLGSIAFDFGVSVEDLMAANGLTDPNVLDVGQSLSIPSAGFVAPTEAPAATEPAEPTSAPAGTEGPEPTTATTEEASSGTPQLAIRGVVGAGDPAEERVTIVNVGGDVSLAGWTMHDEQGNAFFFPALSLFQGGAVNVHTRTGQNTVTDLFWNQAAAIWETGETVTLVDPTGADHTTFVVP